MNAENEAALEKIDRIKEAIAKNEITSEVLAAQIVLYRSLGMGKDVAICCMEELARRRSVGDTFDFESFIDVEVAKIPKVDIAAFKTLSNSFTMQTLSKLLKKK